MSKKLVPVTIVLMLVILACSTVSINTNSVQGSGKRTSETRNVRGFTAVDLAGAADVQITTGSTEAVVIEADDNILPLIQTQVALGKLVISTKGNTNFTTLEPVHVNITVKALKGITISGSGNINVTDLNGDSLTITLPGSGNITVSGATDSVDINLRGSGNIICSDLKAKSATVRLGGSGNIQVYASESLDATISGSGIIHYTGNPANVVKDVTGSGSINP